MTVLGPIAPPHLGFTQMHEHLVCNLKRASHRLDGLMNNEPLITAELATFKQAGGQSIVDLTNNGMGRDPHAMRRIATATGVNVVAGCGWYRQLHYDERVDRTSTNELAREMVLDLTVGMDGTDIRAGIIGEIGTEEDYLTAAEERVFRAAARAHKQTGAAISTHAMGYPVGLAQLDVLAEEGVDPSRVIIGHCDHYLDLDYHEAIIRRGAYVEYDNFGNEDSYPDALKISLLVELLRRRYVSALLLSTDTCRRPHLHAFGGHGYDHIALKVLPSLRAAGVSDEQIHTMLVENPARVLPF
jgi:predicted metal-dependent phosphotriesterase family hydrolase